MSNNSSYRGFYQAGLSMSSNHFGHESAYSRSESQVQPSYYSAIDKTYQLQDSRSSQQTFGQDLGIGHHIQSYCNPVRPDDYNQLSKKSSQASYTDYVPQDISSSATYISQHTREASKVDPSTSEPLFGVDFSDEQQKKQWERFQQHFQQAFEQQLTHQIHLQIQQQGAYGSGRSGNLGSAAVDGVSVYFGDDNVGKRTGTSVGYGGNGDDGRVGVGEGRSSASNSSSRSASHPGHSKFYCATCDISYANSLAFTSHLGSSDHKLQREKEARRPKPVVIMPLSSSSSPANHQLPLPSLTPSRKEIWCQLCNIACSGADVYAQHMKSEEHQRILRMNSDNRKRPHDRTVVPSMPLPEEFGMNFDKTRSFADAAEDSIGQEFVEETRNMYGNIVRVVCNLCKVEIPNPGARRMHMLSQQHRMLCEQKMASQGLTFGQDFRGGPKSSFGGTMLFGQELGEPQQRSDHKGFGAPCFGTDLVHENNTASECKKTSKETEDDECVRQKHSLIYPTTGDFRAVQKVSGSCDRWLKTIMNNLMDGRESYEINMLRSKQKLISSVIKVGSLAKGLLLHYDLSCDLLVLTRDWPTKSLVRTIYNQLEVLREKNTKDDQSEFTLTISDGEDLITLENLWHPLVRCNILISSHSASDAKEQERDDDRLGRKLCLQHLNLLEQTKWFQTKAFPLPSCVLVVRTFKDLRHQNKEFTCLTDEAIERLVSSTIKCLDGRGGPGTILKKSLEFLASSFCEIDDEVLKNDGDNEKAIIDKCKDGDPGDEIAEYLSYLTPQEKEDIRKLSQHLLSQKMREILYSQNSDSKVDQPAAKEEESKGKRGIAERNNLDVTDDSLLSQKKVLAGESGMEDLEEFNQHCIKKVKVI